ncbi:hypothetical protein OF83DRAFT_1178211 [Amylostereum chailletii]|nr:hypothetical protein OF83DRAFT_1178211 [Amylostereum chailletii]
MTGIQNWVSLWSTCWTNQSGAQSFLNLIPCTPYKPNVIVPEPVYVFPWFYPARGTVDDPAYLAPRVTPEPVEYNGYMHPNIIGQYHPYPIPLHQPPPPRPYPHGYPPPLYPHAHVPYPHPPPFIPPSYGNPFPNEHFPETFEANNSTKAGEPSSSTGGRVPSVAKGKRAAAFNAYRRPRPGHLLKGAEDVTMIPVDDGYIMLIYVRDSGAESQDEMHQTV